MYMCVFGLEHDLIAAQGSYSFSLVLADGPFLSSGRGPMPNTREIRMLTAAYPNRALANQLYLCVYIALTACYDGHT